MSEPTLRMTWAWLWGGLALAVVVAAAAIISVIALSGSDQGEVALAVALIGFPAVLGALALGTMALAMARPSGSRLKTLRRWVLALVGAGALLGGLVTIREGDAGAVLLIAAGVSALAYLALDLRRERGE